MSNDYLTATRSGHAVSENTSLFMIDEFLADLGWQIEKAEIYPNEFILRWTRKSSSKPFNRPFHLVDILRGVFEQTYRRDNR